MPRTSSRRGGGHRYLRPRPAYRVASGMKSWVPFQQGPRSLRRAGGTPEKGSRASEKGWSTPERGSRASEKGSSTPERGWSAPERGWSAPEKGSSASERGSSASERGSSASERGSSASERGSSASERGSSASEKGSSASEFVSHGPGHAGGRQRAVRWPVRGPICSKGILWKPIRQAGEPGRGGKPRDSGPTFPRSKVT